MIRVLIRDLPTAPNGKLAQFAKLHFGVLAVQGGHSGIKRCSHTGPPAHRAAKRALPFATKIYRGLRNVGKKAQMCHRASLGRRSEILKNRPQATHLQGLPEMAFAVPETMCLRNARDRRLHARMILAARAI